MGSVRVDRYRLGDPVLTRAQEARLWVLLAAAALVGPVTLGIIITATSGPAAGILTATILTATTFAMAGVATHGYGKGPRP